MCPSAHRVSSPQAQAAERAWVNTSPKPSFNRWGCACKILSRSVQGFGFPLALHITNQHIYIYKNGRTDVCLSIGMWRANGNLNPCTDLDEILPAYSYLSKEGFDAGLTPLPPLGWGGLETLKPVGQRCSAGCFATC